MIHYFYGTLQVGIGQTLCSFEHVSCFPYETVLVNIVTSPSYYSAHVSALVSTYSLSRLQSLPYSTKKYKCSVIDQAL